MPNLRGPSEDRRKLYANIVHSILLYGAPIWADAFGMYKSYQAPIKRIQRSLALRTICAYRSVSYESATLLARIRSFYLLANKCLRIYTRKKELYEQGDFSIDDIKDIYESADLLMKRQWLITLSGEDLPGRLSRSAILPFFEAWLSRKHGSLNYFISQVLTGLGSFAAFLHRIGKVPSSRCFYCDSVCDSAKHTMFICPAWEHLRRDLYIDLDIGNVADWQIMMPKMLQCKNNWNLISSFIFKIMSKKENQEDMMRRQLPLPVARLRGSSNSGRSDFST